jgi:hypothetical protein
MSMSQSEQQQYHHRHLLSTQQQYHHQLVLSTICDVTGTDWSCDVLQVGYEYSTPQRLQQQDYSQLTCQDSSTHQVVNNYLPNKILKGLRMFRASNNKITHNW